MLAILRVVDSAVRRDGVVEPEFERSPEERGQRHARHPRPAIDVETSALLAEAAQKGFTDVTIDVRDVDYMGSQYLGALAAVAADMKKRGGGLTVRARGNIAELIKQVGLHRVLTLDTE